SKTSRLGGALQQPPHLLSKNASNRNARARHAATALSSRVARGGCVSGRLAAMNKNKPTVLSSASVASAMKKAAESFAYASAAQNFNQTMPGTLVSRT
uniref:Uncharacterized protein n=1 Tax=Romanomermis culicivorax TaxID=13658 RepID=A0A915HYG5_ROMCU